MVSLSICAVSCRYSNLVLADSASTILLCARQVGSKLSSFRSLQDGGNYSLPPEQKGLPPNKYLVFDEWMDILKKTSESLLNDKQGKSAKL